MRRTALYSRSPRARLADAQGDGAPAAIAPPSAPSAPSPPRTLRERLVALVARGWLSLLGTAALVALLALGLQALLRPTVAPPTQDDIDAAVKYSLQNQPPAPSAAAQAYDVIRPSVVLVRRLRDGATPTAGKADGDPGKPTLTGVGTGVVFSDDGMIFTNLHVVTGSDGIGVVFADGTESEAELIDAQPENDLAVLKAKTLPDDLRAATLRSTRDLRSGDEVLAVGFPFGIGPTATWGVVSGLRRQHYSEQGHRNLVDLIQFDAAANPGNSGGPLVTRDGDVVGIVTSILNPTDQGFFVGIAFAVPIENAAAAAGISPF